MKHSRSVLIAGVGGFVGLHVARELREQKYHVIGVGLAPTLGQPHSFVVDEYIGNCDLTNSFDVQKLPLERVEAIINLAGLAQNGMSFTHEAEYLHTNVAVHTTIIDQLLAVGNRQPRIIAVSSGSVYESDQPMPLKEVSALVMQSSPYTQSKIVMEQAMQAYRLKGMNIIIARPFNHTGPGQKPGFLIPDLYEQLLAAQKTSQPVLVGNLHTKRDYSDARDVARAYVALMASQTLRHDIYNICSGHSRSGQSVLAALQDAMHLKGLKIEADPARFRPHDAPDIYGSYDRLRDDTGWNPTIPFEQTIADFVADNP